MRTEKQSIGICGPMEAGLGAEALGTVHAPGTLQTVELYSSVPRETEEGFIGLTIGVFCD